MTKFLLLVNYDGGAIDTPMTEWAPEEVQAHMDYYRTLNAELTANGELVDRQALTGPELAKIVTSDGVSAPVVTDGPFAEVKELLAGYQMIDVESEARAIEIAALVSAVPGPGGVPTQQPVEVRQVMGAPPGADL
ncbi:MAG TPA: YciI family protein [Actinopolymorphaceae bacterium]|nr:YciI family protein [Actinopolymorphaceae bacterium]